MQRSVAETGVFVFNKSFKSLQGLWSWRGEVGGGFTMRWGSFSIQWDGGGGQPCQPPPAGSGAPPACPLSLPSWGPALGGSCPTRCPAPARVRCPGLPLQCCGTLVALPPLGDNALPEQGQVPVPSSFAIAPDGFVGMNKGVFPSLLSSLLSARVGKGLHPWDMVSHSPTPLSPISRSPKKGTTGHDLRNINFIKT